MVTIEKEFSNLNKIFNWLIVQAMYIFVPPFLNSRSNVYSSYGAFKAIISCSQFSYCFDVYDSKFKIFQYENELELLVRCLCGKDALSVSWHS